MYIRKLAGVGLPRLFVNQNCRMPGPQRFRHLKGWVGGFGCPSAKIGTVSRIRVLSSPWVQYLTAKLLIRNCPFHPEFFVTFQLCLDFYDFIYFVLLTVTSLSLTY